MGETQRAKIHPLPLGEGAKREPDRVNLYAIFGVNLWLT